MERVYCAYCGKEVPDDVEWDHYEDTHYYHCDCETALEEIAVQKDIRKLNDDIYHLKFKLENIQKSARYQIVTKKTVEKI